ncbi:MULTISPECIES: PTS ascorbate transporter subunit IIC [Virgibacillus]|uniref:Ascorbate-specific PTS system EIIC component n=1 Tax=Virgibacillus dokdonensis TaxID=302167 RepID=A0A2K9J498_9BACI|nr:MULTISPECIES: PTS ascorbate transporter subunit IIC [Virgibacillus]AUJ25863.1 Ascorbate-specific permease IIC component UlaA [Virgibacillus dokdonensis]NWO14262.1 PTS ascorbate transporter subunit IIC [Virgibacillus sp.]
MDFIMYLIDNIFSQAVFVIGIVVLIGLLVQKKSFDNIVSSTAKTMIGFLLINTGAQSLGISLLPLQPMLSKVFHLNAEVPTLAEAQMESFVAIGTEMALIFALGFIIHILFARMTPFKYVHLSAHVSFFYAGLIAALLKFGTNMGFVPLVLTGSLILGFYLTFTCSYVAPLMKNIKGGEGFTLGHSSSSGVWIAAKLGGVFGNKKRDLEDIKIPKMLNFLREMTIALTVIMFLLFLVVSIISGPTWVMKNISDGRDVFSFSLLNGLQFGLWITVILAGVRMLLAEIIPAFHGIADKVIPNAKPGLDVPLLFPNYPTSVIVGFLTSLVAGFVGMIILALIDYPIAVFPALIPTFFTGAATAIFGNSTGGVRGALIGSFANGLILILGQAFLLPQVGSYASIMRILSETDYALYGPLLGLLLKLIGG